jgi:hypothetical protein
MNLAISQPDGETEYTGALGPDVCGLKHARVSSFAASRRHGVRPGRRSAMLRDRALRLALLRG